MPKSKRSKLVTLSKVKKKTRDWKLGLITSLRSYVDQYPRLFVLHYTNMRNDKLQELREELKGSSRFCFTSTKVAKVALGRSRSDEYQEGLAEVSEALRGTVGLFFTKLGREEVLQYFESWGFEDFARAGCKATQTFKLAAGPLQGPDGPLPHTLEPRLRQHKLPVNVQCLAVSETVKLSNKLLAHAQLTRGVIELIADHTVCEAGQILSPDQAAILRVYDVRMATFKLVPVACWEKEGGAFEQLAEINEDASADGEPDAGFGGVEVPELPASLVV